jgi:DNA-binding NarL/FixJ family response regulator
MKIAIIDDSNYKIESIKNLIYSKWDDFLVCEARSFQGGLRLLEYERPDLVLMDMSLPTSEESGGRLGGRDRMFGGRDLMTEIEFLELDCRVIVVTQFEEFPEMSRMIDLQTLLKRLQSDFPKIYAGGVFYGATDAKWSNELSRLIEMEIKRA